MGEYDCTNCNEKFWLEEPPEDIAICEECLNEINKNQ